MTTSRLIRLILSARSSSLLFASGLITDLSKSNSASAAIVTFSATGFGAGFAGAGLGAGAGPGLGGGATNGAGGGAGGVGIRSGSHSGTAMAGVKHTDFQHCP